MAPSVTAGRQTQKASLSAILCDLQACISEPGRILYGWTRDIVCRLLFSRGTGTGEEIVDDAVKLAGAAETETASVDVDEYDICLDEDDCYYYDSDIGGYVMIDNFHDLGDDIDRSRPPPSFTVPYYHGDGDSMCMDSYNARYMVELLAVRPRFGGVCTFVAFTDDSECYSSSRSGEICRNVDRKGYLKLHSEGGAIGDHFSVRVNVPGHSNRIADDVGEFSYTVDPYTCDIAVNHTISTRRGRKMDVTFVPIHTATQVNVYVTLDLISSGSIYYVYDEITACHQLYDGKDVILFSHGKEDKAKVIDGKLPLSRNWAAVPIYLKPLLTIKMNLCVQTNQDHDDHGRTISFQDYITFYRDDPEKTICTEDNDKVKVKIAYQ